MSISIHMPLKFIDTLRYKASSLAYNSPLYDWSLGEDSPDRLIVKPTDPWPGDAEKAQNLLDASGVGERTGPVWYSEWWMPEDCDEQWINHMHSFEWLRDLRTLGGAVAREQGRVMLESWIDEFSHWHEKSWRVDLIGRRLSMWVCHYDFFCANADPEFEDKMLGSLMKQAKHLSNVLNKSDDVALFHSAKGIIFAGIALEGQYKWIEQGLDTLRSAVAEQLHSDGGHVSRSPATLLEVLEILVDIRSALNAGGHQVLQFIEDTISNASSALRAMRYRDRKLALFHGAQEGDVAKIDAVLALAGTHQKARTSMPLTGFERLESGRAVLLMDTGTAAESPYDKTAHASALGFEFNYGMDRIFVSCGSHPSSPEWEEALRFTAAHNTACLDYRNSCEIKKSGHFGRKVEHAYVERSAQGNDVFVRASHDGYVSLNGITHTRNIYLGDDGYDLRGEDDFEHSEELVKPVDLAIRFHLHPNVRASLVNNDKEVLLLLKGGMGWRFKSSGAEIKLEDSLYLGHGVTPQKTQQIVLYKELTETQNCVKWALKKED